MAEERRVEASELLRLTTAVFAASGMGSADAELLADSLVDADLSGVHSHGVPTSDYAWLETGN